MRIGEKLVCKRDYYTSPGTGNNLNVKRFHIGKKYQIIVDGIGFDSSDENFYLVSLELGNGRDSKSSIGVWFTSNNNNKNTVHSYIWDYFYTEKEIRKLKLKEIGI